MELQTKINLLSKFFFQVSKISEKFKEPLEPPSIIKEPVKKKFVLQKDNPNSNFLKSNTNLNTRNPFPHEESFLRELEFQRWKG